MCFMVHDAALLSSTALRSWTVDLTACDLNKELQLFEARHTAQFSSQVKGQSGSMSTPSASVCGCVSVLLRDAAASECQSGAAETD